MDDLSTLIPPSPIRMRVMDFNSGHESIHTQLNWEKQRPLLGPSDISFAINAPLNYLADEDGARYVFFVDPVPCARDLGQRGFQIVAQKRIAAIKFKTWAEQVIQYVRYAAVGCDWPGRNHSDFRQFLSYSQDRQLLFALSVFDYSNPMHQLQLPCQDFRTLYLLFIDNEQPDIQALSELAETVEETNPHLETLVLGTAVMPNEPARVMFLGETFASLMR